MRTVLFRVLPVLGCLWLAGCSSTSKRSLPKYERPLARAAVMNVRTTAYTHSESDHLQHGRQTALGTRLQSGSVHSAAADWSRWPAGSTFRIRETGEVFKVDDYGWALAGTNTIDLYKPSRARMNAWGVRQVTIENLSWGDPRQSLAILRPRSRHRHVKRMADQLEERMREWTQPAPGLQLAAEPAPLESPAPRAIPAAQPVAKLAMAEPARPVNARRNAGTAGATGAAGTAATREAFLKSQR